MQAKALVKERAQRNLLLLIDGQKSEEMLLANVVGIKPDDFTALEAMGLIEPLAGPAGRAARPAAPAAAPTAGPATTTVDIPTEGAPLDYAHFTETLTQLISKELGLRGFTLTLAVEKAGTIEELMEVARRAIDQIRDRKGAPAADAARKALFGG
jgi:hypothetical protein